MQNVLQYFSLTTIATWAVFGFISGFIAHLVDPSEVPGGLAGTVLTGVIGALIGGFLASAFLGVGLSGFNFPTFAIAVAGSLLVAFLYRAIGRATRTGPALSGERLIGGQGGGE